MNRSSWSAPTRHDAPRRTLLEAAGHAAAITCGGLLGGVCGLLLGAVGGPIGMVTGGMTGAVAGALAGEAAIEGVTQMFEARA